STFLSIRRQPSPALLPYTTLFRSQSGHVIMPAYATTGDGILTGLHVMARMAATGRTLADLASVVTRLPQVLVNVPVADRAATASDRKSTRLNSSHVKSSYAGFCLK